MMNMIDIDGYKAVVSYDPDIKMFRGEFAGLPGGGADFYATTVDDLAKEGRASLKVFLDMCREDGIEPAKDFSGRFNVRIQPALHAQAVVLAKTQGKSLNAWVEDAIKEHADHSV